MHMWLRRTLVYVSLLVMLAALWLGIAAFVTLNDAAIPEQREDAPQSLPAAQAPLKLMVWNIGYSGLGEESDFQADGGQMLRPPGREAVEKNLAGIQAVLREEAPGSNGKGGILGQAAAIDGNSTNSELASHISDSILARA